jgi:hypothetical protein
VARIFGGKFLDLSWDLSRESYWVPREEKPKEPAEYERQF